MHKSAYKFGNFLGASFGHLRRNSRCRVGASFLLLSAVLTVTCTFPEAARQVEAVAPPPRAEIFPVMRCIRSITAHIKWTGSLAFSPDGTLVATTGDSKVVLWNAATGAKVRELFRDDGTDHEVAFLGKGDELACMSREDLLILETASLREKRILCTLDSRTNTHFCCSRDGKSIFTTWWNDCRRLDARSGKQVWSHKIPGTQRYLFKVAVSPLGKQVAVNLEDEEHCISVRDGGTGKELYRIPNREKRWSERYMGLAFTPDGRFIVAPHRMYNRVRVWNAVDGKLHREVTWPSRPSEAVQKRMHGSRSLPSGTDGFALSPDGKSCAVICSDGFVRVFELATGGLRGQHEEETERIAYAPDGRTLATLCAGDHLFRFWDLRNTAKGATWKIEPQERERLWNDLASKDASVGFSSLLRLENAPTAALDILRQLRRVPPIPPVRLARLVEQLDDDEFATREAAMRELEGLGVVPEALLRREAERPRSSESGTRATHLLDKLTRFQKERIRHARGVEILEAIGTADAKKILAHLAGGHAGLVETEDARAALARSKARSK
jgi:WD40 repeat protein